MRISELSAASGVPVATIKYYLREGLLPAGHSTAATRAEYDESHLRRLALIRALIEVVGLSVQRTHTIVGLLDAEPEQLFESLGTALAALPPEVRDDRAEDYPRARDALARLGLRYDPRYTATAQLERAIEAADAAGLPVTEDRLAHYGEHIIAIADAEVAAIPDDPSEAISYAVLGTAVYEPVLLALRRLAHHDRAARLLDPSGEPGTPE